MQKIVQAFGSVGAVAEALHVQPHAVSNWRRRGIPDAQKWRLLLLARERGLALEPEDLGLPPRAPRDGQDDEQLEEAA